MPLNLKTSTRILSATALMSCCVFSLASSNVYAQERTSGISSEQLLSGVQGGITEILPELLKRRSTQRALADSKAVSVFYEGRNYVPYWVSRRGLRSSADDLIELIEESWTHGLNPYSYHLNEIYQIKGDGDRRAELELLLSDAYLRLGQDLTGIRVNPSFMNSHKRYWQAPMSAEFLFARLNSARDVEDLVESYMPRGQTYRALQRELIRLVDAKPEPYESVLPIRIRGALYPNERSDRVPDLRARLGVSGPQTEDAYLYDDKLAAAVIRFQRENGLKDDGIIGSQTLTIMNVSKAQKIKQIIANLERLRWVEEDKPRKFVVVNVPSATLWAVDNGRVEFDMPVIVGRKKRATNIFRTEIDGVRLNPTWTVPPTIKKDDILPKLREDPAYLTNKGMQLIASAESGENVTLDPAMVEWESVTEADLKRLRMVQVPGRGNPLGFIRVLMPNGYNIYLHDTNEPHYFERANRAASSGCVRMKDPQKMANFILRQRSGWDDSSLDEYLADSKMKDLYIQEPIPVYLLYYTVWLNDRNEVVYGNDLYGFDKDLIKMLEDIDGIFIPVDNT